MATATGPGGNGNGGQSPFTPPHQMGGNQGTPSTNRTNWDSAIGGITPQTPPDQAIQEIAPAPAPQQPAAPAQGQSTANAPQPTNPLSAYMQMVQTLGFAPVNPYAASTTSGSSPGSPGSVTSLRSEASGPGSFVTPASENPMFGGLLSTGGGNTGSTSSASNAPSSQTHNSTNPPSTQGQ